MKPKSRSSRRKRVSTTARRLAMILAAIVALGFTCGRNVDRRSILAPDLLAKIEGKAEQSAITSVTNLIEVLLIENKYLFRLPVLEPRQDTVDAIKAFQKDKSFPVTGRIDRAQFELLEKGVGEISADINLPPGGLRLILHESEARCDLHAVGVESTARDLLCAIPERGAA